MLHTKVSGMRTREQVQIDIDRNERLLETALRALAEATEMITLTRRNRALAKEPLNHLKAEIAFLNRDRRPRFKPTSRSSAMFERNLGILELVNRGVQLDDAGRRFNKKP